MLIDRISRPTNLQVSWLNHQHQVLGQAKLKTVAPVTRAGGALADHKIPQKFGRAWVAAKIFVAVWSDGFASYDSVIRADLI